MSGEVIPAATVVPLWDGGAGLEVLMLRRNAQGDFGGLWVFPGGKVDDEDVREGDGETDAAKRAAVREAEEEAGLRLTPETLVVFSHWIPPPEASKRFSTWFFLSPADGAAPVVVHQMEVHDHAWIAPSEALKRRDAGEMGLAPPTWMTLWRLSRYDTVAAAMEAAAGVEPARFATRIAVSEEGQALVSVWAGDAAYEDLDLTRPGPRRRLIMERGGWRAEVDEPDG